MSELKLTPWFPGHVKPARAGVYETDSRGHSQRCYQYWSGSVWGFSEKSPFMAAQFQIGDASIFQNDKWRGLACEPIAIDEQTDDHTGIVEVQA